MKLTLGLIFFSVLVAVNSVTGANPKYNDGPVYNPKGNPDQVIVEEDELCDNYYLICNPRVKGRKYLACVYDRHLEGSYCKKVDVYYNPPKKETKPTAEPKKETKPTPEPKNDGTTKQTDPKDDGTTKGTGIKQNVMAALVNAIENKPIGSLLNNRIGSPPGAA